MARRTPIKLKPRRETSGLADVLKFILRQCMRPRLWVAIGIVLLLILLFFSPLGERLHHEQLVMDLEMLGPWAPVLFVLLNILATSLGIPGTVLTVVGGAVFGLAWGTVWSAIGLSVGAICAFLIARYLFHDWAIARYGKHPLLMRLNQSIERHAMKLILAVRLFPISPFNLVNFLFGLTRTPLLEYGVGTAIGIIPGVVLYTWVGVSGRELLEGGGGLSFSLALTTLTVLSMLPIFARRWFQ
ncbi:MAG: TVP38/TMEM64 family protein [Cyanobacteria bacterium P01_E01_bin.45]